MAISTSSNSLLLPGVEDIITSGANSAIDTNARVLDVLLKSSTTANINTLITSLQTLTTKISSGRVNSDPLPTFAVFSNYQNNPAHMVYDSYFQPISGGILTTEGEIKNDFNGQNYTTGAPGQGGVTSNWVGATPMSQADGHWIANMPGYGGQGHITPWGKNRSLIESYYPFFGTVIGLRGQRPNISLWYQNTTIGVFPRGGTAPFERFGVNNGTYATWHGGTNTGYGQIGYNDRTDRLVLIESRDGANAYRMHVWRNVNRPLIDKVNGYKVGQLHRFLSEAKTAGAPATVQTGVYYYYNDFTWQQDNSQNYNESRYRMTLTVGDNEYVGMSRFTPSNVTRYATFLPNIASTTGLLETKNGISHTTSYGIEQGNNYGMRYQQTWDNNWIAAYSPYGYYGSGMNVIFSEVADPRNYYTGQNGQTSWGCQIVPFNEDKFLFNDQANNADGNVGMRIWLIDLGGLKQYGRQGNGAVIGNGGGINLQPSVFQYSFDTRYTSTNYPVLLPISSWTNG